MTIVRLLGSLHGLHCINKYYRIDAMSYIKMTTDMPEEGSNEYLWGIFIIAVHTYTY